MLGTQVTVSLQIMGRLMVAGQVSDNLTMLLNYNTSLAETPDSPVLPSGYVAFPEFELAYKMFETNSTYNEARKMCLEDNGQLAVIDTRDKVEKILNQFTLLKDIWVGLLIFRDTKEWTTIDGKSTNDLPWGPHQPSGLFNCGYLAREEEGLVDLDCDWKYPYLCEIARPRK